MTYINAPKTAKQLITVSFIPGAKGAAVDIALPTYAPDFDLTLSNPILNIAHINETTPAMTVYEPNNFVPTHAACVGGTYYVGNTAGTFTTRTFQLGDATKAASLLKLT